MCNIGTLNCSAIKYLDRVESNFPPRAELHPGIRVPLHTTGVGKLLLSYLTSCGRKRVLSNLLIERFSRTTITNFKELEVELKNPLTR
ncbi:MAG: hypothetical protein CMM57_05885 [Rhodospirillaceae bacterium]|nr:hypothetical protein [Rhodospirillaceae bacterium]